jgi:hypothetical protein
LTSKKTALNKPLLTFHPAIVRFGDIIFADLWSALERERKLLEKMGAVRFHDDGVTITAPAR